jgi:uncharacterized protein YcbK (DUF882 family)
MVFSRRSFMRGCGAAMAVTAIPAVPAWALAPAGARSLKFQNLHTGEKLALDYWANGAYEPEALRAINNVLRDFRTGEVHTMDPRLLDLLWDVNSGLDTAQPFEVISGYRSPQTNKMLHERSSGVASSSLHMQGMAIDIRVPGRSLQNLHDVALKLDRGGVGYYPTSDFVHVDVGRVRKWSGV